MAVLVECPICKKRQTLKNNSCPCGENLSKARKSGRVQYFISYRVNGVQRTQLSQQKTDDGKLVNSLEYAKAEDGKVRANKKEGKILDILPQAKTTFKALTDWYLDLETTRQLASWFVIEIRLRAFNAVFGDKKPDQIKPIDLEEYQIKRKAAGLSPGTIDHEFRKVKAMLHKAFNNEMIRYDVIGTFKKVKPTMKKGSDVRDRILSQSEFDALMVSLPGYLKPVVAMGWFTGMRKGEVLGLTWDHIDLKGRVIKLRAEDTKDDEARIIPVCDPLYAILKAIPRAIHINHVFLYRGKPMHDIRAGLSDACKKADILYGRFEDGGFIYHDLRHSFVTRLRKAGVQEGVIMQITGHSTREMFDRYNNIDLDDMKEAVSKFG